jgi:hypothetical protein
MFKNLLVKDILCLKVAKIESFLKTQETGKFF